MKKRPNKAKPSICRNVIFLIPTIAVLAGLGSGQNKRDVAEHEQTRFSAEDVSVRMPVPLSKSVLEILKDDRHVQNALQQAGIGSGLPPTTWFSASRIHLDGPKETALIVMSADRLRGANINTFWVFRKSSDKYDLILTTSAHDLRVLRTKSNGYKDMVAYAIIGGQVRSVMYQFDGQSYIPK